MTIQLHIERGAYFFVVTTRGTERFYTIGAAQLFIDLLPANETLISTNAIWEEEKEQ